MIIPSSKPRLHSSDVLKIINHYDVDLAKYPLVCVGVRGYYLDSMGDLNKNDRGIYDDAIFLYSDNLCIAYNGNTDPSYQRKGKGTGEGKGMACLVEGVYYVHKFDLHKGKYMALCQRAGEVTVLRDGDPPYLDKGNFGINIHRGGNTTTSSEGCQTIAPTQWSSFIETAKSEAKRFLGLEYNLIVVPYCLISEENRKAII